MHELVPHAISFACAEALAVERRFAAANRSEDGAVEERHYIRRALQHNVAEPLIKVQQRLGAHEHAAVHLGRRLFLVFERPLRLLQQHHVVTMVSQDVHLKRATSRVVAEVLEVRRFCVVVV